MGRVIRGQGGHFGTAIQRDQKGFSGLSEGRIGGAQGRTLQEDNHIREGPTQAGIEQLASLGRLAGLIVIAAVFRQLKDAEAKKAHVKEQSEGRQKDDHSLTEEKTTEFYEHNQVPYARGQRFCTVAYRLAAGRSTRCSTRSGW